MFFLACHFYSSEPLSLQDIKEKLCAAGLVSVRDEMGAVFSNRVRFLGIEIPPPIDIPQFSEIFARADAQGLCHIKVSRAESYVELHILASDEQTGSELNNICKSLVETGSTELGTVLDAQLVQSLRNRLKDGPNGKMLKDDEITVVLTNLYNPETRNFINSVIQQFGQEAIPQAVITGMLGKKASSFIKKLVSQEQLFDKRYVLNCDSCGTSVLEFPDREAAAHSLEGTVNRKCRICDEGKIQVVEAFAVKEAVYKGLKQGLWLEKLTYEAIKPLSIFADAGQIIDTFELDVIAVSYGSVILVECKDTSFGQNDFLQLDAKAEEIGADIIGIVTTQPLHENVSSLIQRRKKEAQRTIFTIESTDDPIKISSSIKAEIAKIRGDYLRRLLCGLLSRAEFRAPPPRLRRRFTWSR